MKFGARILKTGIAITLSLYIAMLLNLEPATFAAVAAVFAIQPSVYRSFQTIIDQLQANILGAIIAVLFTFLFGNDPFIIGLAVIIIIAISIQLKTEATIPLAVVTVILIMESTGEHFLEFSLSRLSVIMIGVFCSFIVNLFFLPPKHETKLFQKIALHTEQITQWIRLSVRNDAEHLVLKEELIKLHKEMVETDQLYLLYKEERNYLKKNEFPKARKLVLFRQMISTTDKALRILKTLELKQAALKFPKDMSLLLINQLDYLTQFHERTLLKYSGKVRHEPTDELLTELTKGQAELAGLLSFYDDKKVRKRDEEWFVLFQIIGLMISYKEELEHLNMLIDSFYTYHHDETETVTKV